MGLGAQGRHHEVVAAGSKFSSCVDVSILECRWPKTDRRQERAIWKLPDQVTKHEFRHWLDAIDTNHAAAQHFAYPEVVLDKVRRSEGEITQSHWGAIFTAANVDIPNNKKINEQIVSGRSPGGLSGGESDP